MKLTRKNSRYFLAFIVNLLLLIPFFQFLIWPQSANKAFIKGLVALIFVKAISFSIILYIFPSEGKKPGKTKSRLSDKWNSRIIGLFNALFFGFIIYKNFGYYIVIYFVASLVVDTLTLSRYSPKKRENWLVQIIYKGFIIVPLFLVCSLIAAVIHPHYAKYIAPYVSSPDEVDLFLTTLIFFTIYYLVEPFSGVLFKKIFGKTALSDLLLKKL